MSEKNCCKCPCRMPSLLKKYVMAVTGFVLVMFMLVHVIGNLQMFQAPEKINTYAHLLHALPPVALWGFRIFMFVCIIVHFCLAVKLKLENLAARGDEGYAVKSTRYAAWSARAMIVTGLLLITFIVAHLIHFTILKEAGFLAPYENATSITAIGGSGIFGYMGQHGNDVATLSYKVFDVYQMVYNGFANPLISLGYVVAMLLLLSHLSHGFHSMFQTIGARNEKLRLPLRLVAWAYGLFVCFGLIAVPAGVMTGIIKPNPKTTAPVAQVCCPVACVSNLTCGKASCENTTSSDKSAIKADESKTNKQ